MKKYISILLILTFLLSGCIGQGKDERPEKIETLVNEAATLFQEKGEEAFPEFRMAGKYYTDDFYLFVWKVEGDKITRVVYPPDSTQEGIDVSDLKDDSAVSITNMFMGIANDKGQGWSPQYLWINPETDKVTKKVSYIRKVVYNDTTYVLGAGYYIN